jgi:hypothetical protein
MVWVVAAIMLFSAVVLFSRARRRLRRRGAPGGGHGT